MFLNHFVCSAEKQGNSRRFFPEIKIVLFLVLSLFFVSSGNAQWVNNPSENTKLVIDGKDPVDISAVKDYRGGAFIFWQDNKNGFQNEVFFLHVDNNGKVTFRADGKKVSDLNGSEENPVSAKSLPNTAIIVWKDLTMSFNGKLLAQRVAKNGGLLWAPDGVEISSGKHEISNYSVCSGKNGNAFVAYITKPVNFNGIYKLEVQNISPVGKLLINKDSALLYSSVNRKSLSSIISDNSGGAFIFWLEYRDNKSVLLSQHIDSLGHLLWGKRPVEVSGSRHNVMFYTVEKLNYPAVYAAWQTQNEDRAIYHQIITERGKALWAAGGKSIGFQKGGEVNPGAVASDSSVILCWTNDSGNDKNIYMQKYGKSGRAEWGKSPVPVIKFKGDQFGQKIISDGDNGAIIAWIDRRNDSALANIYAQKINSQGKPLWVDSGLEIGSNYNTLKSYLSLVADENGGAIAVFKNKRDNKNDIYGQRIFSSGTYVSQIIGFNTSLSGDSVKIEWYAANESGSPQYTIERTTQVDIDSIKWQDVDVIRSDGKSGAKQYTYFDLPEETGTLYYRVVQSDSGGDSQASDISRINYFGSSSGIAVAQNIPNPFSDSTEISFYLPEAAKVSIEFYNSHVEKIKEINDSYVAGENKITFYSKGLKPGIYFYRFKAGNFVDVKKMVITN